MFTLCIDTCLHKNFIHCIEDLIFLFNTQNLHVSLIQLSKLIQHRLINFFVVTFLSCSDSVKQHSLLSQIVVAHLVLEVQTLLECHFDLLLSLLNHFQLDILLIGLLSFKFDVESLTQRLILFLVAVDKHLEVHGRKLFLNHINIRIFHL